MVGENPKRNKEVVQEDVQRLRDWLDKQPHLPHDVEHEILLAFVCGTKTLEGAKRKLDAYFSNRNRAPKLYDETYRNVNAQYREKAKAFNQYFLSNPTPEGYRVFVWSLNDCFDKVFYHPFEATRTLMTLELFMMTWPDTKGVILIMDCSGVPSSVITMLSPTTLAACFKCFQDGYPIKLKGCYLFNASPFIEFVVNNIFKPAMKAKLFNRIKVSNEPESCLKQYLPIEILPSNYGGKDKSSDELIEYCLNKMEEKREWYLKTTRQSSDEKKRPADSENTYGIEGTFRKLAVD